MKISLSLAAGTLAAAVIVILFQLVTKGPFPPLEAKDPFAFSRLYEEALPYQLREEFIGLAAGLFIGCLLTALIYPKRYSLHFLLVPAGVVSVIVFSRWGFRMQKELILLALPVWVIFSFGGYYTGYRIKAKRAQHTV